jgi:hypothetical protein
MKQFLLPLIVIFAIGCGEPAPDAKVETERLDSAKQMRTLFDGAGGDYNRLSATDKAAYIKSFGGNEENAKRMWETMKSRGYGGGTSAPASGTTGR